MKPKKQNKSPSPPRPLAPAPAPAWLKWFLLTLLALGAMLALAALIQAGGLSRLTDSLRNQGWGDMAAGIARNKISALFHGAFMTLAAAGLIWALATPRVKAATSRWIAWALVGMVMGDAFWLSRHYVSVMPYSFIEENDVIRALKNNPGFQRAAVVAQSGFYNTWLTYLFPYQDIKTINITQMPRMPTDYKNFLGTVGTQPLRLWRLSAVGFLLGPAQLMTQLEAAPETRGQFEVLYAYNAAQAADGGIQVIPATPQQPGQHAVLRSKAYAPRYALLRGWASAPDDQALQMLASPAYPLFQQVLLAPEEAKDLAPMPGTGVTGMVEVASYRPGHIRLKVNAPEPVLLRMADKYDAAWRARVDGAAAPIRRADYIFQCLYVPAGIHDVRLDYAPFNIGLWVQLAGVGLCLAALVSILATRRREPAAPPPPA